MVYSINRYNLERERINSGGLTVDFHDQKTTIHYVDDEVEVYSEDDYHPLVALEKLRVILESKYESLINCSGCRKDTSYRPRGGTITYLIENGKQATKTINLFEPTNKINLLCTVQEHKESYEIWLNSL